MADAAKLSDDVAGEIIDGLPCGVVSFADDGSIKFVNATLAAMLGYERAELLGRHVEMILTVAGRIFFQTHVYPLTRLQGRADELFVLLGRKDGGDVGALFNAARHERSGIAVTDCVLVEVRERRKYEDALLRAKQTAEAANAALEQRTREAEAASTRLEEQAVELELQQQQLLDQAGELEKARAAAVDANQAKSQFLAVMSHELRTPLNAIGGYTQLIEMGVHGPVTEPQREALARILRGQRHLLRLINDVLNLARIEAGRVEYAFEDVVIAEVVGSVMPMIEPQLTAAGLTSSSSVPPELIARADREKMQQILINLLTNAVKFTPAGGQVSIGARADRSLHAVLVSVTDSGIGISAEKLDSVFEPFVQVEVGHTRQREGSGLGLAISRDLARGMGGDLRAHSVPERGSTFTLVLAEP